MRVPPKLLDPDQHAALARGCAQLRAAISARTPHGGNARGNLLGRGARSQHLAEIDPGLSIEAQIPEPVRGEAAAVTAPAERRRGRSDNSEHRAIRKPETLCWRG